MQIKNFWTLTDRQLCDCEMILDGSFSPLNGFMVEKDYDSVLKTMRLVNGKLFPIPIVLDVNKQFSQKTNIGDEILGYTKIQKKTNSLVFLICHLYCKKKIIASASGVWKMLGKPIN